MTVKQFITQVFLTEYRILSHKFHYISFALIGLGIEFLGACLDPHDFEKTGQSRARFVLAVETLFPSQYAVHAVALYEDLRSGFAHLFRPGARVAVTNRAESANEGTIHLAPFSGTGQIVLVAEDFYQDFEQACTTVIQDMDSGVLSHPKLTKQFLRIT